MKGRFGLDGHLPRTLEQLGQDLRLTRERVRQIEARAIHKLRQPYRNYRVKDDFALGQLLVQAGIISPSASSVAAAAAAISEAEAAAKRNDVARAHERLGTRPAMGIDRDELQSFLSQRGRMAGGVTPGSREMSPSSSSEALPRRRKADALGGRFGGLSAVSDANVDDVDDEVKDESDEQEEDMVDDLLEPEVGAVELELEEAVGEEGDDLEEGDVEGLVDDDFDDIDAENDLDQRFEKELEDGFEEKFQDSLEDSVFGEDGFMEAEIRTLNKAWQKGEGMGEDGETQTPLSSSLSRSGMSPEERAALEEDQLLSTLDALNLPDDSDMSIPRGPRKSASGDHRGDDRGGVAAGVAEPTTTTTSSASDTLDRLQSEMEVKSMSLGERAAGRAAARTAAVTAAAAAVAADSRRSLQVA